MTHMTKYYKQYINGVSTLIKYFSYDFTLFVYFIKVRTPFIKFWSIHTIANKSMSVNRVITAVFHVTLISLSQPCHEL